MKPTHLPPHLRLLSLMVCLMFASSIFASLPRKALLGLSGTTVAETQGVQINRVIDATTASAAGLKIDDVLLAVNGEPVTGMNQLIGIASGLNAGDQVLFSITRNGKTLQLESTAAPRPLETAGEYEVIYDEVRFHSDKLRSVVYRPQSTEKLPAVYFLQGFSCGSIDYALAPNATVRQLADQFAQNGFVVFRVEKPGVGDSIGDLSCSEIDYHTEVAAFEAGYRKLADYPFVDSESIILFGHSLGGVTAPLLAQNFQPKGVITYGSVVKPWYEYMIDIFREQAVKFGRDYQTIERRARLATPFLYDLMVAKKDWSEISRSHAEAISTGILPVSGEQIFGRHYTFWAALNDSDLTEAWRAYSGYVLAMYGTYDIEAISPEAAHMTADIVNAYHPGHGEISILEQAEHGFARVPGSFEQYVAARNNGNWTGQQAADLFDQRIPDQCISWMRRILESEG